MGYIGVNAVMGALCCQLQKLQLLL